MRGTGYAGDTLDQHRLAAGRKQALAKGHRDMESQCEQLEQALKSTAREPSESLLMLLRQVLRNFGIPFETPSASKTGVFSKNGDHSKLTDWTLQIIEKKIIPHYPQAIGNLYSGDDSLLQAMKEAAEKSQMMVRHPKEHGASKKELQQAETLLRLVPQARKIAQTTCEAPDIMVTDSKENYRSALRPHAFAFCEDLKHHHFRNEQETNPNPKQQQPKPRPWVSLPSKATSTSGTQRKRLFQELSNYQSNLPIEFGSSILVRAMEGSMEHLRVLIFGPEDTPYANGCFIFDMLLHDYPRCPPKVQFMTTGGGKFRFNPNLYQCGKVCLSLLGTWSGPGWQPNASTLYQLLISIQSLILGESQPYFNEPGYEKSRGSPQEQQQSDLYNRNIRDYTCAAAILPFLNGTHDYDEFREAIDLHFNLKKGILYKQLHTWAAEHQLTSTPPTCVPAQYGAARQPAASACTNHIQSCLNLVRTKMTPKEDCSDVQVVEKVTATAPTTKKRRRGGAAILGVGASSIDGSASPALITAAAVGTNVSEALVISIDSDEDDDFRKRSHGVDLATSAQPSDSSEAWRGNRLDEEDGKLPADSATPLRKGCNWDDALEFDENDEGTIIGPSSPLATNALAGMAAAAIKQGSKVDAKLSIASAASFNEHGDYEIEEVDGGDNIQQHTRPHSKRHRMAAGGDEKKDNSDIVIDAVAPPKQDEIIVLDDSDEE